MVLKKKIPLDTVKKNDRLIVRAGDKIPTDGIIKEGATTIDESAVTGESRRVAKRVRFEGNRGFRKWKWNDYY